MSDKLLTTEAAAARLDVATTTVRDWLRKGHKGWRREIVEGKRGSDRRIYKSRARQRCPKH